MMPFCTSESKISGLPPSHFPCEFLLASLSLCLSFILTLNAFRGGFEFL